jgi:hypothetical protein
MMSLSNSIHLPLNDASMFMNPVIFPPGRGKLATNPLPTGSETTTNTIGIVLVSRCSAATTSVVCPRITSGLHACRLLGIERQWPNGNAPPKSMMNSRRFIRSPRETTELYARNTPGVGTKPPFGRFDTSTFIEVDREMRTRSYRPGMITIAARPQPSLATG